MGGDLTSVRAPRPPLQLPIPSKENKIPPISLPLRLKLLACAPRHDRRSDCRHLLHQGQPARADGQNYGGWAPGCVRAFFRKVGEAGDVDCEARPEESGRGKGPRKAEAPWGLRAGLGAERLSCKWRGWGRGSRPASAQNLPGLLRPIQGTASTKSMTRIDMYTLLIPCMK